MDDVSERVQDAIAKLERVADELTADEAAGLLDETVLQVFWKDWPRIGGWAGALWRRVNDDLAQTSSTDDGAAEDIGGEAG
jgi:hypothetical protein